MSATLGATEFFEKELTRLTGAPSVTVRSDRRPVPLQFEYSETPLSERVTQLLATQRSPVYLVHFTQRAAAEAAQALMSLPICTKEEKAVLATELERMKFNSPYGKEMKRWLRHGIGVHHAGLLPKYRILVEQLAQKGLLKLICGTDTLGVGINVPIRTVLFTQLWKYDGQKAAILSVRDFRQVSGRAGRAGYDSQGYVIVQAPEHVIENKRAEEKAAADPTKKKKLVKARAPEGSVGWDAKTFERLRTAAPEELSSRFDVSHGMLLLVLSRDSDGCRAMRQHDQRTVTRPRRRKRALRRRAWQLFRALLDRKIVEIIPRLLLRAGGCRCNIELQDDFSLHQALSLYLIDFTLAEARPRGRRTIRSTCAHACARPSSRIPTRSCGGRWTRRRRLKIEEWKAAGIPYEERMAKLEEVEHPKPLPRVPLRDLQRLRRGPPVGRAGERCGPSRLRARCSSGWLRFLRRLRVREYGLEATQRKACSCAT